jgi:VWFA-related protein
MVVLSPPPAARRILAGYCRRLSCVSALFPGQKRKKDENPSQTIFRVPVNIVVVNATVTDKSGNPVTDLTAKDFKVYDDGKLQDIQTFALESYGPAQLEEAQTQPPSSALAAKEQDAERTRILSLVVDDLAMESVVNFPRMIEAVKQFVERDMSPQDQVRCFPDPAEYRCRSQTTNSISSTSSKSSLKE